ncbi:MAG: ATP-binding cassette domain-containing protein [Anaerolineales bacterium]|nr:ATP-binding cassette domain-containing protein [Anaerolineales bacterium]
MEVCLKDIRKFFGHVKANDGICLTLDPGRIYGLLGENGAGKSTLMKILSGYHQQDTGTIELDGEPAVFTSPAEALRRGVGMIYQDPLDVPTMRVVENYLLGRDSRLKLDLQSGEEELNENAARMGFVVAPRAYIDTLSLGERQQLEMLRMLAFGAEVFILDEPTTGISSDQKDSLFQALRTLAHGEKKTVILVSHKLSEVQELCDHVMVLRRGRKVGEADIPCRTEDLVHMMFEEIPPKQERISHTQEEINLTLDRVSFEDDRLAVHDVDLNLHAGEVFGLAGLEGSGQRLLLKVCAGLLIPDAGSIQFLGQDVTSFSYHRMRDAGVAYLPAGRLEEGLIAGLSVMEHVVLSNPRPGFTIDWAYYEDETAARIARYEVVGTPRTPVDALSGGNQQRTLFALLRPEVKLILLEHPTRGLDVRSAEWIWQLMFERVRHGTSILFMSADLDELVARSDRIAAFSGGRMSRVVAAADTTADELGHLIGGEV